MQEIMLGNFGLNMLTQSCNLSICSASVIVSLGWLMLRITVQQVIRKADYFTVLRCCDPGRKVGLDSTIWSLSRRLYFSAKYVQVVGSFGEMCSVHCIR